MTDGPAPQPAFRVVFVCTGNICRSAMAEVMLRDRLARHGDEREVVVSSAGTGSWHAGEPMDPRAADELAAHGLPTEHVAAGLADTDEDADLLVALDHGHAAHLAHIGVPAERVRLLRTFDPSADSDEVVDPYHGDRAGFTRTYLEIAAALPGLVAEIDRRRDAHATTGR